MMLDCSMQRDAMIYWDGTVLRQDVMYQLEDE